MTRPKVVINFAEEQYQVFFHDFYVYIQGVDVTPFVRENLVVTLANRDGFNTASFGLDGAGDRFTVLEEDLLGEYDLSLLSEQQFTDPTDRYSAYPKYQMMAYKSGQARQETGDAAFSVEKAFDKEFKKGQITEPITGTTFPISTFKNAVAAACRAVAQRLAPIYYKNRGIKSATEDKLTELARDKGNLTKAAARNVVRTALAKEEARRVKQKDRPATKTPVNPAVQSSKRNPTDPYTGSKRWPLNPRRAVFHKNDPVRIFIHNPLTPDDQWMFGFTGYLDQYPRTEDMIMGNVGYQMQCYDIRALMQKMRVQMNPILGPIVPEPLFKDPDNFFADLVVQGKSGMSHPLHNTALEIAIELLITGGGKRGRSRFRGIGRFHEGLMVHYPSQKNYDVHYLGRLLKAAQKKSEDLTKAQKSNSAKKRQAGFKEIANAYLRESSKPLKGKAFRREVKRITALLTKATKPEGFQNLSDEERTDFLVIMKTGEELRSGMYGHHEIEHMLENEAEQANRALEILKKQSTELQDHIEQRIVSAKKANQRVLQQWHLLTIFGLPLTDPSAKPRSYSEALIKPYSDITGIQFKFLTEQQVKMIGRGTTTDGDWAPDNAMLHFLLPPKGTETRNLTQYTFGGGTTTREWSSRYDIIVDFLNKTNYEMWITAAGDIVVEFPMFDFHPEDFGELANLFMFDYHITNATSNPESGDIISGLNVTGGYAAQHKAPNKPEKYMPRCFAVAPVIAARTGVVVEQASYPFVASRRKLQQLTLLEFQKRLINANSHDMQAAFRPFLTPNRPILNEQDLEMGLTQNVVYTAQVHSEVGTSVVLKYVRHIDPDDGSFRFITGGRHMPISFRQLQTGDIIKNSAEYGIRIYAVSYKRRKTKSRRRKKKRRLTRASSKSSVSADLCKSKFDDGATHNDGVPLPAPHENTKIIPGFAGPTDCYVARPADCEIETYKNIAKDKCQQKHEWWLRYRTAGRYGISSKALKNTGLENRRELRLTSKGKVSKANSGTYGEQWRVPTATLLQIINKSPRRDKICTERGALTNEVLHTLDTSRKGKDYVCAISPSYRTTRLALDKTKPGKGSGKGARKGLHTTSDAKRWWGNRLLICEHKGKYCIFRAVDHRGKKKSAFETSYNARPALSVTGKSTVSFRFFGKDAGQGSPTDSRLGPCVD